MLLTMDLSKQKLKFKSAIHNLSILVQFCTLTVGLPAGRLWRLMVITLFFSAAGFTAYAQTQDLNYYIQQGENNSPLLKDYQNQIKTGAYDSMLIKAANRPQVLANGQVTISPSLHGYGYDQAITNGGNYAALVTVSQPIFNKGILAPQYRNIALQNQALNNTSRISKLDLKKNISAQYISAYATYQQLLSNKEVYQLLYTQQAILKKLVQSGLYQQTDYLNLQVALQSQEITVSQLIMQYKTDIATLNYLCGINDTGMVLLTEPDLSAIGYYDKSNSVFFRQFTIDSLKIANNKSMVDARYKPSVSWFADAGMQSSRPDLIYKSFGADFGLNLSVPIYDGKQRNLDYQKLKIAENTREDYASFFNHQYNQQRAMLVQQLNESESLVSQIQEKLKSAQLLIDLDKKQLNAGDLRITDYILAVNNYLTIKNNLDQAEISRYQIINQLNYWNH